MRSYRLRLRPLGPWCTPWHADTIFAGLCWQVYRLAGEKELRLLISRFLDGDPPFVLSDGFPEGWLPCPLSARLQRLDGASLQKKLPEWIPEVRFRALLRDPQPILPAPRWPVPLQSFRTLHASIDRSSGTTREEGGLYELEEWWFGNVSNSPRHLVIFVKTQNWLDALLPLFDSLGKVGFGKKRSTGHGAFELEGNPEPCDWMDDFSHANAFASLSHFIPAADHPTDGRWRLRTKYPKFSPDVPVPSPFKGRILMIRPGSVFRLCHDPRPFYGTMLKNMSPHFPDAVHYGLAFPVPLYWPQTD